MRPLVPQEPGNAPQHAQRLNGPRGFGTAHVLHFPAECFQDPSHLRLGSFVVPADEHRGFRSTEVRTHHVGASHAVEGLHEVRRRIHPLELLHQAVVQGGEELQDAVLRRGLRDGVRGVDHGLAGQVLRVAEPHGGLRTGAFHGQHHQLGPGGHFLVRSSTHLPVIRQPFLDLLRVAGGHADLVSMLEKAFGQGPAHDAGADDADVHDWISWYWSFKDRH